VDVISGPQTGSEGSLIEEARAQGMRLTILPDLLRQISPLHDLHAIWQLYRRMRRERYAIVHTHSSKAGILGRLAARLAGVPIIVHTVHGWSFHDYMPAVTRRIYILLERWMARFSHALIVVAEQDIQKGLSAGIGRPEQYHVIRSAIPLEIFDPEQADRQAVRMAVGLPLDARVVGNVGRFSPQKNPLDWVRVAAIIARADPHARFLLVGDGPLRAEVEALLAQEGLSGRTVLPGLRRDVARMLAAMDVFLLTSLWEGLPRVIPQAMAMGLPIVATRADGSAEAIKPGVTGYLCQAGDLEDIAQRCLDLLADETLRRTIGARARQSARNEFDLCEMIRKIDGLYLDLVSGITHPD
jgi:glycosyltransferase involved in cell wall biosynthesis